MGSPKAKGGSSPLEPREPTAPSVQVLRHLEAAYWPPSPAAELTTSSSYPPISSIPRTTAARLSQPDAFPSTVPFPSEPVPAATLLAQHDDTNTTTTAPPQPRSVLYLAYGSNLCAKTFLGRRGIRPISQVNVSAPTLQLVFDLPGLPYLEPCFANTAIRKPKTPPKLPPKIPDLPDLPDLPPYDPSPSPPDPGHPPPGYNSDENNNNNNKEWDDGLIGVVYEVTPDDYAHVLATEGGGMSYQDILVPCLPLPANVGVPERPPQVPVPFLAHTLFAPRLPDVPGKPPSKDDGDDDKPKKPTLPNWAKRLLLPMRRPDPNHAQPSARYLELITTGAAEHDLPSAYQEYLGKLQAYTVTTWRQRVGQVLFLLVWIPMFIPLALLSGSGILTDKETGRLPVWFVGLMAVLGNLMWGSYDGVWKGVFGEGERTLDGGGEEEGDGEDVIVGMGGGKGRRRSRAGSVAGLSGLLRGAREAAMDEEKRGLLAGDW